MHACPHSRDIVVSITQLNNVLTLHILPENIDNCTSPTPFSNEGFKADDLRNTNKRMTVPLKSQLPTCMCHVTYSAVMNVITQKKQQ